MFLFLRRSTGWQVNAFTSSNTVGGPAASTERALALVERQGPIDLRSSLLP
jgi:hypothetical protein